MAKVNTPLAGEVHLGSNHVLFQKLTIEIVFPTVPLLILLTHSMPFKDYLTNPTINHRKSRKVGRREFLVGFFLAQFSLSFVENVGSRILRNDCSTLIGC